jgi:hypothetical protein
MAVIRTSAVSVSRQRRIEDSRSLACTRSLPQLIGKCHGTKMLMTYHSGMGEIGNVTIRCKESFAEMKRLCKMSHI